MDSQQISLLLEKLDVLIFLIQTLLLFNACSCGLLTVILFIHAKNQRNII